MPSTFSPKAMSDFVLDPMNRSIASEKRQSQSSESFWIIEISHRLTMKIAIRPITAKMSGCAKPRGSMCARSGNAVMNN